MAEQVREIGLPGRRCQKVVPANHLVDSLRRVVDNDREVVGGDTVAALDDEIVDSSGVVAVQYVVDGVGGHVGAKPQRGRPAGGRASALTLIVAEVAASAGVGALR